MVSRAVGAEWFPIARLDASLLFVLLRVAIGRIARGVDS